MHGKIRAGTGGGEAALWASDLFKMYQKFADLRNWTWTALEVSSAESGGLKEALVQVASHRFIGVVWHPCHLFLFGSHMHVYDNSIIGLI